MDENLSLLEAQFAASGTIYGSDNPAEILSAIVNFIDIKFLRADLGLLSEAPGIGEADPKTMIALIAQLDHLGMRSIDSQRRLGDYPAFDAIAAIEVLHVADVVKDTFLEPSERQRLLDHGVQSVIVLPLVVTQRLIGMIQIESVEPTNIQPQRLRTLRQLADQAAIVFQNQSLLKIAETRADQLSRQVSALEAINRIATGVNTLEEEQEMLDFTARRVVEVFGADRCGIVLIDPDRETGTVVSEYPTGAAGMKIPLKGNPIFDLMSQDTSRPLVINDTSSDPRIEPETRALFKQLGTTAILIAPLVVQGELIGSLGIDLLDSTRAFNEENAATAQTMGAQLAVGLQNRRLILDAQRRADQLARVAEFSQNVQATLDIEQILHVMMTETAQMLMLDRMIIALYDPRIRDLQIVARYDNEVPKVMVAKPEPSQGTFALDIWRSGQSIRHEDTLMLSGTRRLVDLGLRSLMGAPIRHGGRALGTVVIGAFKPKQYTEADMALFQQLLNQFAVTLENSEAYAASQRLAQTEARVNQISAQLQRTTDLNVMARTALRALADAVQAKGARIRLSADVLHNTESSEVSAARRRSAANVTQEVPMDDKPSSDQW